MNAARMTLLRRWLARHARNAGTAATLAALSAGALAGPIAFNRHAEPQPALPAAAPAPDAALTVSGPTRLAQAAAPVAARPSCCTPLQPALRVRVARRL